MDTESRHLTKKVKHIERRLQEEEVIKEDIKYKQISEKDDIDTKGFQKRQQQSFRTEKNKEWREENEWQETESVLLAELVCPVCEEDMLPPKQIYQCGVGHLVCQDCLGKADQKVSIIIFYLVFSKT